MSGFQPVAASGRCPCGGGGRRLTLAACCGPLLRGERLAATAEQLMRSRYSAFALGEVEHLLRTQRRAAGASAAEQRRALLATCHAVRWLRLEVLATEAGGADAIQGTVRFRAHYRQGSARGVMQELSRFGREGGSRNGAWLYLEALELSDG
ncbi:MAG: YchJ family protein [Vulcanococcus sp.]